MKIIVAFEDPPIPLRQFDYCAWDDDLGADSPKRGWGRTRLEAINDLKGQYEDDLDMDEPMSAEVEAAFRHAIFSENLFQTAAAICHPVKI